MNKNSNDETKKEMVNGRVVVADGNGQEWVELTIGIDLGDRTSRYCVIENVEAELILEGSVKMRRDAMRKTFEKFPPARVALEVGTHSRWVSQVLVECGHEVIVANARQLRVISQSPRKNDRADAELLARLARADKHLLRPIEHRGETAQADLTVIRARAALVKVRSELVNTVRGLVKASGERIASCSVEQFPQRANEQLPQPLRPALAPLLEQIEEASQQIHYYDCLVEHLAREKYPETQRLTQVTGVGALTGLSFVLTIDDPHRFRRSRDVGCYLGLKPKQRQSGDSDPQLHISKTGDEYLRALMVSCSHYILGPFGSACYLRQWGTGLAERGGDNGKKRAVVAVARKLAVLLHRLWVSGEAYEPKRGYAAAPVVAEAA